MFFQSDQHAVPSGSMANPPGATNLHEFYGCSSSRVLLQPLSGLLSSSDSFFDPDFSHFFLIGVVQSKGLENLHCSLA